MLWCFLAAMALGGGINLCATGFVGCLNREKQPLLLQAEHTEASFEHCPTATNASSAPRELQSSRRSVSTDSTLRAELPGGHNSPLSPSQQRAARCITAATQLEPAST